MSKFEKMVYGMSIKDIREKYMESDFAKFGGLNHVIMEILVDCLPSKRPADFDQKMNIALYLLEQMDEPNQEIVVFTQH
jgi:hypothetical protein